MWRKLILGVLIAALLVGHVWLAYFILHRYGWLGYLLFYNN